MSRAGAASFSLPWRPSTANRGIASSPKCPTVAFGLTPSASEVPEVFGLRLTRHAKTKFYRVIWRIGHDVGAKLISPAPLAIMDHFTPF